MKKFFIYVIALLCISCFFSGCENAVKKMEKEKKIKFENDIKFFLANSIGNFSIIPTGVEIQGNSDAVYNYSLDELKKFHMILEQFEKRKRVKVISYWIEGVNMDQVYLLTINQPIQPADSTGKILISQNKQIKDELRKLQKVVAKIQKGVKRNSIKSDSILQWLYNE